MSPLSITLFLAVFFLIFWVVVLKLKNEESVGKEIETVVPDKEEIKSAERKEKIVSYLEANGKITNDDIQNLFSVSDATATRYLQQFEDEGLIEQKGQTGHAVYYSLK